MADLGALRSSLLALHRELLQAQRIQVERFGGRMSSSELLQAAAEDFRFGWLRTISELITAMDEAAAEREEDPDAAEELERAAVDEAKRLFAPPDEATAFGARYLKALQDHPEVVLAHRDVIAALER